jgi:hypothetical protein
MRFLFPQNRGSIFGYGLIVGAKKRFEAARCGRRGSGCQGLKRRHEEAIQDEYLHARGRTSDIRAEVV